MSGSRSYYAGVDIGASTAKVAIIDDRGRLAAKAVARSGTDFEARAESLMIEALKSAGIGRENIGGVVSTGYGRRNVPFADDARTEISCHAAGCYHFFPQSLTIIDIGGQDNKIIKVDETGRRTGFKMNRKCAAGTGAFLEEMALRLDLAIGQMDHLARQAEETVELGSFCTVFTATEILEKIRAGYKVPGLVRGIYSSVVKRVLEMDTITDTPVMSGGVAAYHPVLVDIFSQRLAREVKLPPNPQLMGAFGAALFARNADNNQAA